MDKYTLKLYEDSIKYSPDIRWGNISGSITDQGDLMDYLSNIPSEENIEKMVDEKVSAATETVHIKWGQVEGNISAQTDLYAYISNMATHDEVDDKIAQSKEEITSELKSDFVEQSAMTAYCKTEDVETLIDDKIAEEKEAEKEDGFVKVKRYATKESATYAQYKADMENGYVVYINDMKASLYDDGEDINVVATTVLNDSIKYLVIPPSGGYSLGNWPLDDMATKSYVEGQHYLQETVAEYLYLTKTDANTLYQPKGEYLTEHQHIKTINNMSLIGDGNIEISSGTSYDDTELRNKINSLSGEVQSISGNYATEQWVEDKHYLTEHQSLDSYATKEWVYDKGYLTETIATNLYQPKGEYLTKTSADTIYQKKDEVETKKISGGTNVTVTEDTEKITISANFTETDPTVPSWAKQSTKPTYTADEVGALKASEYETIDVVGEKEDGTTVTYKFLVKK